MIYLIHLRPGARPEMFKWVGRHKTGGGGWEINPGGGCSRDKSDARHYDPLSATFVNKFNLFV